MRCVAAVLSIIAMSAGLALPGIVRAASQPAQTFGAVLPMSPRLASRITGTPGCLAWMCAIRRSSASSARRAAKCAICGL